MIIDNSRIIDQFRIIRIPFPTKQYQTYLKEVGASEIVDVKDMTSEQKEKIFLRAIEDFYAGTISIDGLSGVAGHLYDANDTNIDGFLAYVLEDARELDYYVRHVDEDHKQATNRFEYILTKVRQYYEEHRAS